MIAEYLCSHDYLRERYDLGIVMVTASGHTVDRVVGLELGADDQVAKPFDPSELLARDKNVLRRMQAKPHGEVPSAPSDLLCWPRAVRAELRQSARLELSKRFESTSE
jgi:DNA-binding response OmpR family regulator